MQRWVFDIAHKWGHAWPSNAQTGKNQIHIVTHERGHQTHVFVLKDGLRQVALVFREGRCLTAEVVGCLSKDEERSFAVEASMWLSHHHPDAISQRRSGEYETFRVVGADRRASA
jgi:hypothetical protein